MSRGSLESEIERLSRQVASLSLRVENLEAERNREGGPYRTSDQGSSSYITSPVREQGRSAPQLGELPSSVSTRTEREALADHIGDWLGSETRGIRQGPSGRDRLNLQSRVYVLTRSHSGSLFDPVLVFHRVRDFQPYIGPGGKASRAVFIGFASEWEARRSVDRAGLQWPRQ